MERPQSDPLDTVTLFTNLVTKYDQKAALDAAREMYQDLQALWDSQDPNTNAYILESGGDFLSHRLNRAKEKYLDTVREFYDFM